MSSFSSLGSGSVLTPIFEVIYESVNITQDLKPDLARLRYTNSIESESAEVVIELIDVDRKWIDNWSPAKGDRLSVEMGYEGSPLLGLGNFEVDEVEMADPPLSVSLSALATPYSKSLRENRTVAYEDATLKSIAQEIADRHGLELFGEIPEVTFKRQTQQETSDLSFLARLASQYDLLIKVENGKLIFYSQTSLEREEPIATLRPEDFNSISLADSLAVLYRSVEISYQEPLEQETIESTKEEVVDESAERREDVLRLNLRVEDKEQADLIAQAKLRQSNADKLTGRVTFAIGRVDMDAGVNIQITGYGTWDGKYQLTDVTHELSPSGVYRTSASIRRIYTL